MVLFALLLVSMTAISIGLLAYRQARNALEVAATARLELVARDIAERLDGELEDRAADITLWSRLEVMVALTYGDVDKALAEFVRQTLGTRTVYSAIVCFGADGSAVASAGDAGAVVPIVAADGPHISVAMPGRLQFEAPIMHPLEPAHRIGTLVAVLAPSRLVDALSVPPVGTGGIAATVRSERGLVLARTRDGDTPRGGAEPMLTAGARMERRDRARGPDLRVTVQEPERLALAGVAALRRRLLPLAALVLALGAALGGLAAWRISHPIRRLTATVQEVTRRGHFDGVDPLPEGGGEVGVLAASFRAMMQSVAEAQRETLAKSRLALLGEVAASLAHDVRTPLSVLKTSAHLLSKDDLPAGERRDLAGMVSAEADRLNGVLSKLVDLARPRPVRQEPVALGPLVERATSLFMPMAAKARIRVETLVQPADLVVRGDGDRLYQALLNLVHNALQAMHGPGVLQVACQAEPHAVRVEVRDSGPGFGPDGLARVFTPFVTTKPDGTGLGLAIVKRIVEEHGGTVGACDRDEGGACVWLRLPMPERGA